jgi:hypothetical protein
MFSVSAACRRLRCCDTRSAHFRSRSSTVKNYASIAFPGTGIHDNLADRAKKPGIPVWKFGGA